MEWYLLYSIVFLAVVVWAIIKYLYLPLDEKKALNLPKEAERYADDSVKSAEAIGKFLKERAKVSGIGPYSSDEFSPPRTGLIYTGRAAGVVSLIREAHSVGCEVVVREWTGHGFDDMKTKEEKKAEAEKRRLEAKLDEMGI